MTANGNLKLDARRTKADVLILKAELRSYEDRFLPQTPPASPPSINGKATDSDCGSPGVMYSPLGIEISNPERLNIHPSVDIGGPCTSSVGCEYRRNIVYGVEGSGLGEDLRLRRGKLGASLNVVDGKADGGRRARLVGIGGSFGMRGSGVRGAKSSSFCIDQNTRSTLTVEKACPDQQLFRQMGGGGGVGSLKPVGVSSQEEPHLTGIPRVFKKTGRGGRSEKSEHKPSAFTIAIEASPKRNNATRPGAGKYESDRNNGSTRTLDQQKNPVATTPNLLEQGAHKNGFAEESVGGVESKAGYNSLAQPKRKIFDRSIKTDRGPLRGKGSIASTRSSLSHLAVAESRSDSLVRTVGGWTKSGRSGSWARGEPIAKGPEKVRTMPLSDVFLVLKDGECTSSESSDKKSTDGADCASVGGDAGNDAFGDVLPGPVDDHIGAKKEIDSKFGTADCMDEELLVSSIYNRDINVVVSGSNDSIFSSELSVGGAAAGRRVRDYEGIACIGGMQEGNTPLRGRQREWREEQGGRVPILKSNRQGRTQEKSDSSMSRSPIVLERLKVDAEPVSLRAG